jgi:hypothetical protein
MNRYEFRQCAAIDQVEPCPGARLVLLVSRHVLQRLCMVRCGSQLAVY